MGFVCSIVQTMNETEIDSSQQEQAPRLLVLGAHPDDAEFHAGGLMSIYRRLDRSVRIISVTDGSAGHHERPPGKLASLRKEETAAAAGIIGAQHDVWEFQDGFLEPTLELRKRVIHEIRSFKPDLVLTHRTCDYHPDHRAVGQAVQDASYLVTVPNVLSQTPALSMDPVVAYMADLFTKPVSMEPDVILNIESEIEIIVEMLACHQSQVFEWLPYSQGCLSEMPDEKEDRLTWLRHWFQEQIHPRMDHFKNKEGGYTEPSLRYLEAYEISEYARKPDQKLLKTLFPGASR